MVKRTVIPSLMLVLIALVMTAAASYAFSLPKLLGGGDEQNLDTFKLIHVTDLKTMMADAKTPITVYDVNGAETRAKFGVIAGAKLLDSDQSYDLALLPHDKDAQIVFYCANTH